MTNIEHLDFGAKKREELADKGQAMPGGGFPIRNVADLRRAIQAYGRAKNKPAAKRWIIKRARALNATDLLPEGWGQNEEAGHVLTVDEFLEHYGVKGMRWGVRKRRDEGERAKKFGGKGRRKSGTQESPLKNLSDKELREIVNRMNLEQQYARLTTPQPRPSALKKVLAAGATANTVIAFARSPAGRSLASALTSAAATAVPTSRAVSVIGRTER